MNVPGFDSQRHDHFVEIERNDGKIRRINLDAIPESGIIFHLVYLFQVESTERLIYREHGKVVVDVSKRDMEAHASDDGLEDSP